MRLITVRVSDEAAREVQDGIFKVLVGYPQGLKVDAQLVSIVPEITQREKLLSKVFGTQFSNEFKEVMATIINEVFKDNK